MGEATYYLKAEFPEGKLGVALLHGIEEFFAEGKRAEDYWQSNRNLEPSKFWPEFQRQFPIVTDMIAKFVGKEANHALAGELSFGYQDRNIYREGNTLFVRAMVWHLADWDRLAAFLKTRFGAERVGWWSDEYVTSDLFGLVRTE